MSAQLWISDAEGRVLGPVPLETLKGLASAGKLGEITRVSSDGQTWTPVASAPDLAAAVAPARPEHAAQVAKAAQLKEQLSAMRGRAPHQVFGVPEGATLEEHRQAFFPLVKRFHPARLPAGSHPALRLACKEVFDFLGGLMQQVEQAKGTPFVARLGTPLESKAGAPLPSSAGQGPRYQLEDFVGWDRSADPIEATVRVNERNAGIFTDHGLANFNMGGVFVPSSLLLPLGTMLGLHFIFEEAARQVDARGKVIWENSGAARRALAGVGVRLTQLQEGDKTFIQQFLRGLPPKARPTLKF